VYWELKVAKSRARAYLEPLFEDEDDDEGGLVNQCSPLFLFLFIFTTTVAAAPAAKLSINTATSRTSSSTIRPPPRQVAFSYSLSSSSSPLSLSLFTTWTVEVNNSHRIVHIWTVGVNYNSCPLFMQWTLAPTSSGQTQLYGSDSTQPKKEGKKICWGEISPAQLS